MKYFILKKRPEMSDTWWFLLGNQVCVQDTMYKVVKMMFGVYVYKLKKLFKRIYD